MVQINGSFLILYTILSYAPLLLHTPYMTWPIGLSLVIPGAIKLLSGLPVALATEHRAMVGELGMVSS